MHDKTHDLPPPYIYTVPAQYSIIAETQNAIEDSRLTVVLGVMANPTPTDEQTTLKLMGIEALLQLRFHGALRSITEA